MSDNNLNLKIMMTWQYTLAHHQAHVGGRWDLNTLAPPKKDSWGAGMGSNGPLEKTFRGNYASASKFVESQLTWVKESCSQAESN